ncbi:MAG TPA: AAA family ATPase [Roseiarcus sp.]|jgi:class 3 adenylate cyclase/tetratricopeptide (TPR) repeat protein|nr:AAA family ATPase [Roseiarcus sp.]
MDVRGWLRGLGLGQYEQKFWDNKIDADVLPHLTADDLEDIGVIAVGDRRRLLAAIAALADAKSSAEVPSRPPESASAMGVQSTAERRPITVMCCALLESSRATKLDPEDGRDLMNAYLGEASRVVTTLGGFIGKMLGDRLTVLFGYPQAQENDGERAVRAALAIQGALADLSAGSAAKGVPALSARIGLDSGPVVVDATGEVFGDALNIALRAQAAAEPGSVLVTVNVHREVAGLFVAEERLHELSGASEPPQLFRIIRASGGGRRERARAQTPFVGRQEELEVLTQRWVRARSGGGQLVLIVGEPGLGKSRLLGEFRAKLAETPHTWVEWPVSQLLQNTPLHPITEWGRRRFRADSPAEQRFADLQNTLGLVGLDAEEYAPLLAPLLDIPLPADRATNFPAEELRRRQLTAVVAWTLAGARSQPGVLVIEDLQWADPTSLELLRALAERGGQAPLFIVATTRPEFRPPWSLRSHHAVISLAPLDRARAAQMINELASRHTLSREVVEDVIERTGGVPLFVEEVTRLLLERGEQDGLHVIPPTLQQLLAARLDRLGPARETAQIASVLGRSFSHRLLQAVADLDEAGLQSSIERLVRANILFVDGIAPEANYHFKHALIQDAAYDGILKSRQQALHKGAAEALIRAKSEPEAIAHHFTAAGADDLAIEWWGKAGEEALRRSAFKEAIVHLGRAIAMVDKAEAAAPRREFGDVTLSTQRLKLHTDYGHAAMWLKGFAADDTSSAYARASEYAGPAEHAAARFVAYYGQCLRGFVRGQHRQALETAEVFLREAEADGRGMEAGVARRVLGFVLLRMGDLLAARSVLERALDDYIAERDGESLFRFGNDTQVSATNFLALTEWHLGELERARQLSDWSTRRAAELGHVAAVAGALYFKTVIESRRGDVSATRIGAESLLTLTEEHDLKTYANVSQVYANWARGRQLDPEAGALGLRQALDSYLALGNKSSAPSFHGLLAELEARRQHPDGALTLIERGLEIADETGEHFTDPYLHRIRGEILLSRRPADPARAQEAFQTAIAIAKGQSARSYELLATLSLAKLCQSVGRPAEAHAVLAPALEGFSPTLEMPEIAEAWALLVQLGATGRHA